MQQHYCQTSLKCWHATELQVWWLLVFPYCFSHDWSVTRVHVQRKAAELWTHWSQSFCCGPQRETLGVLGTLFWWPTRAQQQKYSLSTYRWCALPPKKALATRSPYSLPKHKFLDLPRDVIHSVARFRLRVHTLRFETATWNPSSSPSCDLCEADDDVQDEKHAIFHCTHPHTVSLRRRYESLFSEARAKDVSTFLHQNNNSNFLCMN